MSITLTTEHGTYVATYRSDAEACRDWAATGCAGDIIAETGELVADVLVCIWPDATVDYTRRGTPLVTIPD